MHVATHEPAVLRFLPTWCPVILALLLSRGFTGYGNLWLDHRDASLRHWRG